MRLIKLLFGLLVCLVVIGLFRGWFTFSNATTDPATDKVTVGVSIDKAKVKADVKKAEEKVKAKFAKPKEKPKANETK